MKPANLLAILYYCTPLYSISQSARSPVTAHYTSAGAYSKNFSDAFSVNANTAALAGITQFSTGVYGEQRFMLADVGLYTAV